MASIKLKNVYKSFGKTTALKNLNLEIFDGEFFVLLGPTGAGKTTALRIISGLEQPDKGNIFFDEDKINDVQPAFRDTSYVFQQYSLYPHYSVYDNLAFPLRCREFTKEKIEERVKEVSDTLNLSSFLSSPARKLTADQKQLISLGRGLVREDVAAVLMDEPLTVIDPDLKFRLRRNLKEINEQYKTTLVYVTHDQNEAMTFAENIIVMDQGEIVQVGLPKDLFERPKTTFVGYFIGSPAMNIFSSTVSSDHEVKIYDTIFKTNSNLRNLKDKNVKLGIRSEFIELANKEKNNTIKIKLTRVEDFGNFKLLTGKMGDLVIKSKVEREKPIPDGELNLYFPPEKCCVYSDEKLVWVINEILKFISTTNFKKT